MNPTVSVLIPTMTSGLTHLAGLLPQLAQEEDAEIIIVDNNSRDGTTNYLSNFRCTVIINTANLGFAKAHNQASKIAQGEYLLLLNNDTQVTKGFLHEMVKTFLIDPQIAIVGCGIFTMDYPKKIIHAGVYFTEDFIPYELGQPVADFSPGILNNDDRVSSVREVPSITGACMMVKKSVFQELGGLNEDYRNGWEDNDFVLRAHEKGYKVWYTGKTSIKHKKFGSPGRLHFEADNRRLYDSIWITTGRAKAILGGRKWN